MLKENHANFCCGHADLVGKKITAVQKYLRVSGYS